MALLEILLAFAQAAAGSNAEAGSRACAACHREIFERYQQTPMARSSGRADSSMTGHPALAGLSVNWFIGSGHLGRNFVHNRDGFLFNAPVAYYATNKTFDLAPGYQRRAYLEYTRPIEPACLQCHASRLQHVAGTVNRYSAAPFQEGGVSCERCHGPGEQHIARGGKGAIIHPSKLATEQRDSICAQCHLTGTARVARRPGARYTPGEKLSDTAAIFVWEGATAASSATSHYEQLAASRCAQSGKLWCASCHSVHGPQPIDTNKTCASCHNSPKHPATIQATANCVQCHMPKRETRMADHLAFTDHTLRAAKPAPATPGLRPFFNATYSDRDRALAFAIAAESKPEIRQQALALLEKAAAQLPNDAVVLSQLSQFYDRMGQPAKARPLAERAVRLDPTQIAAAVNLGGYLAAEGRLPEAMNLWRSALRRNPGLMEARVNLAVALARTGDRAAARSEIQTALEFEPQHPAALRLRTELGQE